MEPKPYSLEATDPLSVTQDKINQMPHSAAVLDLEGRLCAYNPAFAALYGNFGLDVSKTPNVVRDVIDGTENLHEPALAAFWDAWNEVPALIFADYCEACATVGSIPPR